ncbi:3-hydroxyacyl-ACP dehydratase FabZ [Ensifer adhaerens]|uniref:3-hydroxyacyl-ACP dehydratase FabZ n=1 Tax=Ensifer adhaerens TaxID=106592 RepID=UPI000CF18790|nr:3-hydroxyacyl-ACP dehydratase FabZ [Ensifer adhaerens]
MNAKSDGLQSADIVKILRSIPHRYPFLLVDRITSIRGEEHCIGVKNVSINEPQFQGHFPDNPVFPGALIIEGMAQTAGVACAASKIAQGLTPKIIYMLAVDKARFRKPVQPGDTLEYHMTKIAYRRNIWRYRGEALVAGELVAEAEIAAYLETT